MIKNTILSGENGQKRHFSLFLNHFEGDYHKNNTIGLSNIHVRRKKYDFKKKFARG